MKAQDKLKLGLRGAVTITQRHVESGEKKIVQSNLIVDGAYEQLPRLLSGDLVNNEITKLAFGSDDTAPTVNDTTITHLIPAVWLSVVPSYPSIYAVKFSATWPAAVNNIQTIQELGLFCADNTMVARTVFQEMKKSAGWEWVIEWTLIYAV